MRKFGLHLVPSHQRIGQLRETGENITNAVMTNTQTKVIFGGLEYEDARDMVLQIAGKASISSSP
jgi:type IV secretory pathway TraG/TraD family ATPase VirD4